MINSAVGSGRKGGAPLGLAPTSSPPPCSSRSISKGCGVRRCPQISCRSNASSKSR